MKVNRSNPISLRDPHQEGGEGRHHTGKRPRRGRKAASWPGGHSARCECPRPPMLDASAPPLAILFANHLVDGLEFSVTLDMGLQQWRLRHQRPCARGALCLRSPAGCHHEEERRWISEESRSRRRKLGVQDYQGDDSGDVSKGRTSTPVCQYLKEGGARFPKRRPCSDGSKRPLRSERRTIACRFTSPLKIVPRGADLCASHGLLTTCVGTCH
jgi:hypothetical protein